MKLQELFETKDEHAWIEKEVHKVLDAGDRAQLLKKTDSQLINIVQNAIKAHGSLRFAPSRVIAAYLQSWRAKKVNERPAFPSQ